MTAGRLRSLEARLASRSRLSLVRQRAAAILLPLVGSGDSLSLLFTRRTKSISHPGQVAFPGGGVDPSDHNREATAQREALEEISLPPERVRVLGMLDDIPNWNNTQAVTPVVGHVDAALLTDLVADPREVASIFTVPLADLETASRWTTKQIPWQGHMSTQFFFDVGAYKGSGEGEQLWGLSAYATIALLSAFPDSEMPPEFARHADLRSRLGAAQSVE